MAFIRSILSGFMVTTRCDPFLRAIALATGLPALGSHPSDITIYSFVCVTPHFQRSGSIFADNWQTVVFAAMLEAGPVDSEDVFWSFADNMVQINRGFFLIGMILFWSIASCFVLFGSDASVSYIVSGS